MIAIDSAEERGEVSHTRAKYSEFSKWERRYIIGLIALAGWFSTLSSFIYYPVITLVALDLSTTVAKINLTVTAYMAVSAIAPAIVGDAADMFGRRLSYMITLTLYFFANMGIALQGSFLALLLLRVLQSAGISGTFSIAYGVIADISTPAERGAYVGAVSFGITTAPSIGPILGGLFGYWVGWRWIFWFLCIVSGLCLTAIILTLPETARGLVGNGSIKPPKLLRLPIPHIMQHWEMHQEDHITLPRRQWHIPNPIRCLKVLFRKDTALVVAGGGIIYMVYSCIHVSLSTLFIEIYSLNNLEAGLIYLPFGIGGTIATILSGKIIDRDYRITAKAHGITVDRIHGNDLSKFPIEKARLRSVFLPIALTVISVIGFGWTLEERAHIAVPLAFQFIAGLMIQTCFNINNALLIDINQKEPATAQASSNIVRCTLAAVAVALLQDVINRIGVGWTFTLLGLMCLITAGLYIVERQKGMQWRLEKDIVLQSPHCDVVAEESPVESSTSESKELKLVDKITESRDKAV